MSERVQDLKPRTQAFAIRIIRMYSELPKHDTIAQVLGKQVLRSGTSVIPSKEGKKEGNNPIE
jgi:hypothetical protein